MPKTRKTKKQKLRTAERQSGFSINPKWLETTKKQSEVDIKISPEEKKFFQQDLTKTVVLTMLVLALELALWQYLT